MLRCSNYFLYGDIGLFRYPLACPGEIYLGQCMLGFYFCWTFFWGGVVGRFPVQSSVALFHEIPVKIILALYSTSLCSNTQEVFGRLLDTGTWEAVVIETSLARTLQQQHM